MTTMNLFRALAGVAILSLLVVAAIGLGTSARGSGWIKADDRALVSVICTDRTEVNAGWRSVTQGDGSYSWDTDKCTVVSRALVQVGAVLAISTDWEGDPVALVQLRAPDGRMFVEKADGTRQYGYTLVWPHQIQKEGNDA